MIRHIIALLIALAAAGVAAVFTAVTLAVFGIYLSGHGHTWHQREMEWHFFQGSALDLVLIAVTIFALVAVYVLNVIVFRNTASKNNQS